jgi:hypothetical protein
MKLHEMILVTAEMVGRPLSDLAVAAMTRRLEAHRLEDVRDALDRCARELRGRLTLADVLERLPGRHPGPDEAWAIATRAYDEDASIVWTDEIAEAFGAVRHMDDRVAARMAFRERYRELVARSATEMPSWALSPGHDAHGRLEAVREAERLGRLPAGDAERRGLLPAPQSPNVLRLLGGQS